MQLNERSAPQGSIRGRLGAAVLGVLGATHAHAAPPGAGETDADAAVAHYQESGGRISATEAVVQVKHGIDASSSLGLNLTFDVLSGGSPNGALPSRKVQTFARPSGHSLTTSAPTPAQTYTTASGRVVSASASTGTAPYTVAPGALPLDSSFHDQRLAVSVNGSTLLTPLSTLTVGSAFSHEVDFMSLSANAQIAQDFNDKNTTLTAGVNLESDWVRPIGGAPVPMSDYALFAKEGNKTKRVADGLIGISQIMSRRWITQLNASVDKSSGYQNDPYKILSALDADGNTLGYVYENRPTHRTRKSLYWENRFALDHDSVVVSARRMTDDWGIHSNTVDVRYRWTMAGGSYIEPQLRYYKQSAADFYRLYLTQGDPLVAYASADSRLAAFTSSTVGVKWAMHLNRDTELSARLQFYDQKGHEPSSVPTALQGLTLYPGLRSQLIQVGLKAQF